MWLEGGETFQFEGIQGDVPFSGAEPASTFFDTNPDAPACVGWVVLVCLGALAILASSAGCSNLGGCVPIEESNPPGGGGGVPDSGGGGDSEGGGGDGDD
jgi:hypothetical protein